MVVRRRKPTAHHSELKRVEEALCASEQRFRAIYDQTYEFIGLLNPDGTVLDANHTALAFRGLQLSDVVGKSFWETPWWDVSPELHEKLKVGIAQAAQGHFIRINAQHRGQGGAIDEIDFSLTPITDANGKVTQIIPEGRRVTELTRAQDRLRQANKELEGRVQERTVALHEREALTRAFLDNSATIAWMKDEDGRHVYISPSYERRFGVRLKDWQGKTDFELWPKETAEQFRANDQVVLEQNDAMEVIEEVQHPDGSRSWWLNHKFLYQDSSGKKFVGGLGVDITDQKRRDILAAAERQVLELVSTGTSLPEVLRQICLTVEAHAQPVLCSILLTTPDGAALTLGAAPHLPDAYNRAIEGLRIGPMVGSCGTAVYHKHMIVVSDIAADPLWRDYRELALTHGLQACWSVPLMAPSGEVVGTFALYYRHPRAPQEPDRQLIAQAGRIAELAIVRSRLIEELRASEVFVRDILDSLSAHICVVNQDGVILKTNKAWKQFAQANSDQTATIGVVGDNYLDVCRRAIAGGDITVQPILSGIEAVLVGRQQLFSTEYSCHSPEKERWFLLRVTRTKQASGAVLSHMDITERRHAEETLLQKQRELERSQARRQYLTARLFTVQEDERQRLARDLHDDITQRLAALTIDLGNLRGRGADSKESATGNIEPLHARAKQLTTDVQRLAHQLHPSILDHLGLEEAVREHVEEFAGRTGLATQVVVRQLPQMIPLEHATCLYRVLQESLQNVSKHANATHVLVRLLKTPQGVGLCVHDDGRGFEHSQETARPRGLGLSSMAERVGLLKGTFRLKTKPGDGTEVHASVPLEQGEASDEGEAAP